MGTSDISRNAFNPAKHYSSVRMQQGRVMIDDDWNENERIRLEQQIKLSHEVIGDHGTPDDGFKIEIPNNLDDFNFSIRKGTYYLEGLRVDLDREDETYLTQENWLTLANDARNLLDVSDGYNSRIDFVYLEAWQQPVTAIEDEELIEAALGGSDTSTRVRTMHRVKVLKDIAESDCNEQLALVKRKWALTPDKKLTVSYIEETKTNDICSPSIIGGYLGAENQAIRVQITGANTFTWGFNNASPLYKCRIIEIKPDIIDPIVAENIDPLAPEIINPIVPDINDPIVMVLTIKLLTNPKDEYHWPKAEQVIELLPRSAILANGQRISDINGLIGRVKEAYNPDTDLVKVAIRNYNQDFFNEWKPLEKDELIHCYLRIWDRGTDFESESEITLVSNSAVLGHTGLKIEISGNNHNSGDYWIIAARPETPRKVIPWKLEEGMSPHGIKRFFAPLAIIRWSENNGQVIAKLIKDCRNKFPPLTHISANDVSFDDSVCNTKFSNVKTVQDALNALCKRHCSCSIILLPSDNLKEIFKQIQNNTGIHDLNVCFNTGIYYFKDTISLRDKGYIKFSGSGPGTQIIVRDTESAFLFKNCKDVTFQDISIVSLKAGYKKVEKNKHLNGTLTLVDCLNVTFENIHSTCANYHKRAATCVTVRNSDKKVHNSVCIKHSNFIIGKNQIGILIINSERSYIEDNQIFGNSDKLISAANQGIVIAGIIADDINIIHNRIHGITQGIHIGTSCKGNKPRNPISAGTAIISGNYIQSPPLDKKELSRERHGIFVGNVNSLLVINNYLEVTRPIPKKAWPIEGIRIYGYLGKRVIVQHNHLSNYSHGIHFYPLNPDLKPIGKSKQSLNNELQLIKVIWPKTLWIIKENVASVELGPDKKYFKGNSNFA